LAEWNFPWNPQVNTIWSLDGNTARKCNPETRRSGRFGHHGRNRDLGMDESIKGDDGAAGASPSSASEEHLGDGGGRQRVEQALRENETRLSLAMQVARLSFWDVDLRTSGVMSNDRLPAILGYQPGEIAPTREAWRQLVHPDDLPDVTQSFNDHLMRKAPAFRKEFRVRCRSGAWRWIHAQGEVVEWTPQGEPVRVIGVTEDIDERRQSEERLRQTARELQMFKFFSDHSNDAVVLFDHEARIRYANRLFCEQRGYAEAELLRMSINDINPHFLTGRVQELFHRCRQGRVAPFESEHRRKDGTRFPVEITPTVMELEGQMLMHAAVRDITARKESEDRMRHISQHDALTGMPNRALLYEFGERMLSSARRGRRRCAFLFIDLDRFKPINDTYGHDTGDAVLKEVARRLAAAVRGEDLVGRLGGDEFLAVLSHIRSEEDAARVARHALRALGRPYHVDGLTLGVSPSIGISLFPQDGGNVDELIRNADKAMYHAKESGRNNFQFFKRELNRHAQEMLRIESRLRSGLERGEFVLYYQPVVDTATQAVASAEALLRWPCMGWQPAQFIPVAEMAGFMQDLGAWVVREACRQQGEWRCNGLPPLPVAVNVSSAQFRQKGFARSIGDALDSSGLSAGDIRLEITESTVTANFAEAADVLRSLREMGIKAALDGFGAGYSSLRQLSRLPVDILKLDQSFIKGIGRDGENESAPIVEGLIALGQSLGLDVVAEGIETGDALAFLRERHCPLGQGFHFSRPMPAGEFEQWCRARLM
jgi:diguanylate cyclase (GGDEF)-like protein/PAS domain S-box-containing protein